MEDAEWRGARRSLLALAQALTKPLPVTRFHCFGQQQPLAVAPGAEPARSPCARRSEGDSGQWASLRDLTLLCSSILTAPPSPSPQTPRPRWYQLALSLGSAAHTSPLALTSPPFFKTRPFQGVPRCRKGNLERRGLCDDAQMGSPDGHQPAVVRPGWCYCAVARRSLRIP